MQKWTFKAFINASGDDVFEDWISGLDAYTEEKIRGLIKRLANSEIRSWVRPYFDILHDHKNIHEIIVKSDKQYRVLGCFGPGPQVFTLLMGATKESKKRKVIWNPQSAVKTAEKRRALVYGDRRYSHEYQPRAGIVKKTTSE